MELAIKEDRERQLLLGHENMLEGFNWESRTKKEKKVKIHYENNSTF